MSHRLFRAQIADRIVVLRDGMVVEEGTHSDLIDRGGEYARLWNLYGKGRPAAATTLSSAQA